MKKIILLFVLAFSLIFTGCSDKNSVKTEENKVKTVTKQAKIMDKEETVSEEKASENIVSPSVQENGDSNKDSSVTENAQIPPKNESAASNAETKENNSVSLSRIRSDIIGKEGISDAMMLESEAMANLYGIDESKIKQAAGFVTMSGTFPHEIIMIEASDGQSAAAVETALKNKLNEVLEQSKTYDAQNYELAQQCRVNKNGNFISLFLSPQQADMLKIYNSYMK